MLRVTIHNSRQQRALSHGDGPLEFGRVMQGDGARVIVDDPFVSRDQLRITEVQGRLHVENLSRHTPVQLVGRNATLATGASDEFDLPLEFSVGTTRIRVEAERSDDGPCSWQTILRPAQISEPAVEPLNLANAREPLTPERLAQWFETVIAVQRSAAGSAEFYEETVRAVVQLVGLDGALVLLRRGDNWEVVASHTRRPGKPLEYSHTSLAHMIDERRTFYRTLDVSATQSLTGIEAVVVSPIFDPQGEVVGALYGQRYRTVAPKGRPFSRSKRSSCSCSRRLRAWAWRGSIKRPKPPARACSSSSSFLRPWPGNCRPTQRSWTGAIAKSLCYSAIFAASRACPNASRRPKLAGWWATSWNALRRASWSMAASWSTTSAMACWRCGTRRPRSRTMRRSPPMPR